MITRLLNTFAIVAILSGPAHSQTTATVETARPRYALTIHGKQSSFKVGDEIRIEVTWKNTSDRPILAAPDIPTAETKYKVYLEDEKGDLAAETEMGRRLRTGRGEQGQETVTVGQMGLLRYLQPGETMNEEIILNKLYDVSKPGRYTVRVQSQGEPDGFAKSNTVIITVTDSINKPAK